MKDSRSDILDFWFIETAPAQWFQKNDVFDSMVRARFENLYALALEGFCDTWQKDADGCLALCILFDQLPRNMFRGDAKAYEMDARALEVARLAINNGFDQVLNLIKKRFIYLPFEHSENIDDQNYSVALFETFRDEDPLSYEYALRHMKIIEKYGRFPHRNIVLGRASTAAENEYLVQANSGF